MFYNTTLEYTEFDEEFNTDRDIAKGHKTFQSKEERKNEEYINLKMDALWMSSSYSHYGGDGMQSAMLE